jgi:hypothetical protein
MMPKLYHFTGLKNVKAIKRKGLLAYRHEDGYHSLVGDGPPVVYLTAIPTIETTDAETERMLQDDPDIVSRRWLSAGNNEPLARFTIQLSSHDRKLKQYGKWLRANYHRIDGLLNPDDDDLFLRNAMAEWWLYFGNIAPSKITECIIEPARPR